MASLAVFHPSGRKGYSEWRRNTLFYYIIFSHWFFSYKILCSGHLAASHFLWLSYWSKQDRLLKGPILFTTLLNLKDIHIQLSHSADKLCWEEEAGSYCMWIYQWLFTLSRIFKISQGGSLSLFSKNDLTLKPSFQSCVYPRSKRIRVLVMIM